MDDVNDVLARMEVFTEVGYKNVILTDFVLPQFWILISRHMRNVAEKCFSVNVPKVLIFRVATPP